MDDSEPTQLVPQHADLDVTELVLECAPPDVDPDPNLVLEDACAEESLAEGPPQASRTLEPIINETFFEDNGFETKIIVIRRLHCIQDMIQAFSDTSILSLDLTFKRILENGEIEVAIGDGVFQDCLTEFWEMFFETRSCGTTYKIPTLHHTYQEREWKAVARVLFCGWRYFHYLPIQLAPPFLKEVLSLPSPDTSLMDVFLDYIRPAEKDVLSKALEDFPNADLEEVLGVLGNHNCSVLPNQSNLRRIIEEIAHKEMVQQPAYIIQCWQPILHSIGETMTAEKLDKITENLKPKARTVAKSILFPQKMSPSEMVVAKHLLQFIREISQTELGLFLRYCTGSDLFLSKAIRLTFRQMNEFSRRPIAYTCIHTLELACDYQSYEEFRSEFSSVLNSGMWIMDMS